MSVQYRAVLWNRQKRIYDAVLGTALLLYVAVFLTVGVAVHPSATAETLLIRAFGTAAFLLLHVILAIGPLCRLDRRFLPLLYNRRHLGVTMFLLALTHGVFSLVQFHALGNVPPLQSLFSSTTRFDSLSGFPFQQFGLGALMIYFLMAATSHDFWLHALTPPAWKRMHMLVYVSYALLIVHVSFGFLQSNTSLIYVLLTAVGMLLLVSLHIAAGFTERRRDRITHGMVRVGELTSISDGRAVVVTAGTERVAVFRYDGKVSAISNVCRHQNGPLGEGRIIDGCVTCPWHGYQYDPATGCSPPPFTDKVPTYRTTTVDGIVYVDPMPAPSAQEATTT